MAFLLGIVLGFIGALPLLLVLRKAVRAQNTHAQAPSITQGFCAVVVSALVAMAGIYALYNLFPQDFIAVSILAVADLLVSVLVAGFTAWRMLTTTR